MRCFSFSFSIFCLRSERRKEDGMGMAVWYVGNEMRWVWGWDENEYIYLSIHMKIIHSWTKTQFNLPQFNSISSPPMWNAFPLPSISSQLPPYSVQLPISFLSSPLSHREKKTTKTPKTKPFRNLQPWNREIVNLQSWIMKLWYVQVQYSAGLREKLLLTIMARVTATVTVTVTVTAIAIVTASASALIISRTERIEWNEWNEWSEYSTLSLDRMHFISF